MGAATDQPVKLTKKDFASDQEVRWCPGCGDYAILNAVQSVFADMRAFTDTRSAETEDQIWLTEHQPVFTQGQAGKSEHLLSPGDIEVVQSDRGGQVTYHGPGQLVAYPILDLNAFGLRAHSYMRLLEDVVITTLAHWGVEGVRNPGATGVWVRQGDHGQPVSKICAMGVRIARWVSMHGLALNGRMPSTRGMRRRMPRMKHFFRRTMRRKSTDFFPRIFWLQ